MENLENSMRTQKVEELAQKAKQSGWSQRLINEIYEAYAAYKGLKGYGSSGFKSNETLDEQPSYRKTYNLVLFKSVNYAIQEYGRIDRQTGEPISFCHLANSVYSRKEPDIFQAQLADDDPYNQKRKRNLIKTTLRRICKEKYGSAPDVNFNVLNRGKLVGFIEDSMLNLEEKERVLALLEENLIISDTIIADPDECESSGRLSDSISYEKYKEAEAVKANGFGRIDCFMAESNSACLKKTLRLLVTFHHWERCTDSEASIVEQVQEHLDTDFSSFLETYTGERKADRAIAVYTDLRLETVQKNISAVRRQLNSIAAA